MFSGFSDYNCFVNTSKILVNFTPTTLKTEERNVCPADTFFPWCGLLFNPVTLDVHIDYSRSTGIGKCHHTSRGVVFYSTLSL